VGSVESTAVNKLTTVILCIAAGVIIITIMLAVTGVIDLRIICYHLVGLIPFGDVADKAVEICSGWGGAY
jgi:hypothetical protein